MPERRIEVVGKLGDQSVTLELHLPEQPWLAPGTFAPAIPGVVVALLALWISHHLTRVRERRKEISELCEALKSLAEKAGDSAIGAWLASPGEDRLAKILTAKVSIQNLGSAATTLRKRSTLGFAGLLNFVNIASNVDVRQQVAAFRDAATDDPFEDPLRISNPSKAAEITAAITLVHAAVNEGFVKVYHR